MEPDLVQEEGPGGVREHQADREREEVGEHPDRRGGPGSEESPDKVDLDLPVLLRRQRRPDEAQPEDGVPQDRVGPDQPQGEKVPEDDLGKGEQDHEGEEQDQEAPLERQEDRVDPGERFHFGGAAAARR
jgi:hypothetical protein